MALIAELKLESGGEQPDDHQSANAGRDAVADELREDIPCIGEDPGWTAACVSCMYHT